MREQALVRSRRKAPPSACGSGPRRDRGQRGHPAVRPKTIPSSTILILLMSFRILISPSIRVSSSTEILLSPGEEALRERPITDGKAGPAIPRRSRVDDERGKIVFGETGKNFVGHGMPMRQFDLIHHLDDRERPDTDR